MEYLPPPPAEKILGLDPRGLLARHDVAERLRAWLPPEPEEIAELFPQFALLEIIGRGGMGAVYRARQPTLGREVAIKLLPAEAAADAAFAERFRVEAQALARLQHPHIVAIYETGETSAGHLFIVMEYVPGQDLAARLAQGRLPVARALAIASEVCAALEYAHAHGVIHRDIKPGNVLLADDGTVKVADFGVAHVQREIERTRLTFTGIAIGTPDYMAPEQRTGRPVDARADLFSLGVMLYEMLTGELPLGTWQPPSRKTRTALHLDAIVEKAMQPDPAHRPQTAAELRSKLEGKAHFPRHFGWFAMVAVLGLATAGMWQHRRSPAEAGLGRTNPSGPPTRGELAPFSPAATAAGRHLPLAALDLSRDILLGNWQWLDGLAGGTLRLAYSQRSLLNSVRLPVRPEARAYDARWELQLDSAHEGDDFLLAFPAGEARALLVLDLYNISGLELVAGADWRRNATTIERALPRQRFLPATLKVRPTGERVAITVTLEGETFIAWEGRQSDLTLPPDFTSRELIAEAGPVLMVSSFKGGLQVRNFEVVIEPEER
jgi:hypothetical protein